MQRSGTATGLDANRAVRRPCGAHALRGKRVRPVLPHGRVALDPTTQRGSRPPPSRPRRATEVAPPVQPQVCQKQRPPAHRRASEGERNWRSLVAVRRAMGERPMGAMSSAISQFHRAALVTRASRHELMGKAAPRSFGVEGSRTSRRLGVVHRTARAGSRSIPGADRTHASTRRKPIGFAVCPRPRLLRGDGRIPNGLSLTGFIGSVCVGCTDSLDTAGRRAWYE